MASFFEVIINTIKSIVREFFPYYIPKLLTFSRANYGDKFDCGITDFLFLLLIAFITSICYYRHFKNKYKDSDYDFYSDDKKCLKYEISEYMLLIPGLKLACKLSIINFILLLAYSNLHFKILKIAPYLIYIFILIVILYIIKTYKTQVEQKISFKHSKSSSKKYRYDTGFNELLENRLNTIFFIPNFQNLIEKLSLKEVNIPKIDTIISEDFNTKNITKPDIIKTLSLDLDGQKQYFDELKQTMIPELTKIMNEYCLSKISKDELINRGYNKTFFKEGSNLDEFIDDCVQVIQLYLSIDALDFGDFIANFGKDGNYYDDKKDIFVDIYNYADPCAINFHFKDFCEMKKVPIPKSLIDKDWSQFDTTLCSYIIQEAYEIPKLKKSFDDCKNLYYSVLNSFNNFKEQYFMESGIINTGTMGEQRVIDFFSIYEDEVKCFSNIRMEEKFSFETDMLVLTEGGIYSIEIKNFSESGRYGLHISKDGQWLKVINGKETPSKDVMKQVNNHLILGERFINKKLKEKGITEKIDLEPIIVIANDNIQVNNESDAQIVRISKLHTILKNGKKQYSQKLLDAVAEIIDENKKPALKYDCIDYIKTFENMVKMYHMNQKEKEKLCDNLKAATKEIISATSTNRIKNSFDEYNEYINS